MKEALLTQPLHDGAVQCRVCEHFCTLQLGAWGKCGARVNQKGVLYSTVYGQAVAAHVDPIEKKPLFHFLPGSQAFSVGTYGCNFSCQWCQNWELSQSRAREALSSIRLLPEALVAAAVAHDCASIAYTYNEPTIFLEYAYDTARLAHAQGIKNVFVSNGFMSEETLELIGPYLDGINVDLKGFTEVFYHEYIGARLEPVKRNISALAHLPDVWVEVTTLVIPGLNDSDAELRELAAWLASVDSQMPWHVSAFFPQYRLHDRLPTPLSTLERAYRIGKEVGLQHVYVGNIPDPDRECTYCWQCQALLVRRSRYRVQSLWTQPGMCPQCGARISGVWA